MPLLFYFYFSTFASPLFHKYFRNVAGVKRATNIQTSNIHIRFINCTFELHEYPSPDVERLATCEESSEHYPDRLIIGDVVDGFFQDGKSRNKWHHGCITAVDKDGGTCNIMNHDGDVSDAIAGDPFCCHLPTYYLMPYGSCCNSLSMSPAFQ
jgi:hypothetical protein